MDVDAYLARIDAERPAEPTADALQALQLAHLLSVPFENLDIAVGTPISLDLEAIFEKIVGRRRGGFCYELNGLFAWLLASLGFPVARLSARTVDGIDGEEGPEFDHLVLRVDLAEPWLVDVGFGDTFRTPMPMMPDRDHVDALGRTYRLAVNGESWDLRERIEPHDEAFDAIEALQPGRPWRTQFRFTLRPYDLADFQATCRWQETESAYFTQHRIATIATPDGRRTLMDDRYIEHRASLRTERPVDDRQVSTILRDVFGIDPGGLS
jgi:N-hydroxyarylamine O-acetyltransferase